MHLAFGSDHRGLLLKQFAIELVSQAGYSYEDFGAYDTEPIDYPDVARDVAEAVRGNFDFGILICGTGIGMSIAANKMKGIRAALCGNELGAHRARQHNDANIICLSGETDPKVAKQVITAFLSSDFEGGRHLTRLNKIRALESYD